MTDPINPPADVPTPTVHVVTDSSCDLPADVAHDLDISIVPLAIRFGDEEFIDREELSTAEFWTRCVNSDTLPETAAPSPGQFEQTYRSAAAKGATGIVVVSLSSALSATMQSAQLAARAIADDPTIDLDVRVIDSRTISMGLGTIALACARAARDGAGIDEIEALAIDLVGRTRVYGALDTLENLKKGGRIGNAKALLATALSIKPIIEVTGGVVEQAGKQRTRSKALAHLVDTVKKFEGNIENLAVLHADCSDVDLFVEMLAPYYTDEIVIGEIGPVIGTHGGRGTIGVAFQVIDSLNAGSCAPGLELTARRVPPQLAFVLSHVRCGSASHSHRHRAAVRTAAHARARWHGRGVAGGRSHPRSQGGRQVAQAVARDRPRRRRTIPT